MNADALPVIGALAAMPAIVFFVLYFLTGRRIVIAGAVTALAGAAAGAFLASVGSAMATSVNPNEALWRGAVIGLAGSAAVAAVLAAGLGAARTWRRRHQTRRAFPPAP